MIINTNNTDDLIAAIISANDNPGTTHTIQLYTSQPYAPKRGLYTYGSEVGKMAFPPITGAIDFVVFADAGAETLVPAIIERSSAASEDFRFFYIAPGATVTFTNVVFRNAKLTDVPLLAGGAIYNDGDLSLFDCSLMNNQSGYGGAIENTVGATLYLENCEISGNWGAEAGGAIHAIGLDSDVTITGSKITGNYAGHGGAIEIGGVGTLTLSYSYVAHNTSNVGGVLFNNGTATITHCVIANNDGTAIHSNIDATTTVNECSIYGTSQAGFALYNGNTGVTVDATNNWWGSPLGPKSVGGEGTGERIAGTGVIEFEPFKTSISPQHEAIIDACMAFGSANSVTSGNPISLEDGEKREEITDLAVSTAVGQLAFTRFYRQYKIEYPDFQSLGMGWIHNHIIKLTVTGDSPDRVAEILWTGGGKLVLAEEEETPGYFVAAPGSTAELTHYPDTDIYELLANDKTTFIFDESSFQLLERRWPSDEAWTYSYSGDLLTEVADDYGRKLVFRYYASGPYEDKLYRVGDHSFDDTNPAAPTGRYVEFGYTPNFVDSSGIVPGSDALLVKVRDVRSNIWSYTYYGQSPNETDVRQLNFLTSRRAPAQDLTGDGTTDGVLLIEKLSHGSTVELVEDGSLELTPFYTWKSISGQEPTTNLRSSTQVDNGSFSRRVVASAANQGIESNAWNLLEDRTYTITARVYPVSGVVKMQASDDSNFDDSSTSTGAWETLTATYVATATVGNQTLQFIASGGAAEFYVDSVSITETSPELTTIVQDRGLVGTELAVNGTMEADSDWASISGASPTTNARSSSKADSGTYSRHVVTSAASQGIEGGSWTLTADLTYLVAARVYPVSGVVKMHVTSETAFDSVSSITGDWQTLFAAYTPTSTGSGRKLQFIASGAAAEFYVDSVSILEVDASAPKLSTTIEYQFNGETRTKEWVAAKAKTHQFGSGIYSGTQLPLTASSVLFTPSTALAPDTNFRPAVTADANGNQTQLSWSEDGKQLDKVIDALGNTTRFSYNDDDTLQESVDVEGRITRYLYTDLDNPRLPKEIKVYDRNGASLLRWQIFTYDAKGRTVEEKLVDLANDAIVLQRTARSYHDSGNGEGLLHCVTQEDIGGANDITTIYSYDTAGRVTKTQRNSTFGSCNITYTVYDDSGNVVASICNYDPDANPDPTTATEAVALFDPDLPDVNRVTTHTYDVLGRRVMTTTDAGASYAQSTVTVYDGADRVVRTIGNYDAALSPAQPYTAAQSAFGHGSDNTKNLVTDTAYNEMGLVRKQVDVLGNVTLYGYDESGHLIRLIRNASQPSYNNDFMGVNPDPQLRSYILSTIADLDIRTFYRYDANGNTILVRETDVNIFGQTKDYATFTVYDRLNRPIKTVRAASNPAYDNFSDSALERYAFSADVAKDIVEVTDYDSMGRVKRTQDSLGNWTLYGYDALGRQVRVVRNASDPSYDVAADPDLSEYVTVEAADEDLVTDTVYDEQGRVIYALDLTAEKIWSAYDGLGRQTKTIVNAIGTATDGGIEDPRSSSYTESDEADRDLITRTTYDESGRVLWTQDVLGRKTWYVYDDLGRQKKVIRNCTYISGPLMPEHDGYVGQHGTDSSLDVISWTAYDERGRVAKTIDSRGNETRFEYDELGRRTKTIVNYQDGVFNPAIPDEDLISTTAYDIAGRVISLMDAAGNETRYEYDAAGRRTKTILNYQDGAFSAAQADRDMVSTTTYNKLGMVLSTTDVRGTQTEVVYDTAKRRIKVTQAAGTALETTSYTCYDKGGRVLRTIQNYIPDAEQTPPDSKDLDGNWRFAPVTHGNDDDENLITTYTLDKLGRPVAVSDALGNETNMTYRKDGQVLSITDQEGTITVYRYDRARRRNLVVQSYVDNREDPGLWVWDTNQWETSEGDAIDHGTDADENNIAVVTYDKTGRVLTQRDSRGNVTSYEYDLLDRRLALTNALNQTWATAYADVSDGNSRVTLTNPLAEETQQDFDRLGRLKVIQYLDEAPKLAPDVTFTYDASGNRTKMSESNGMSTVRETLFGYDQARRLTSVGFDTDGDANVDETVSYEYDAGGLRTKLTLPGSLDIVYEYDAKGRLISLTNWDSDTATYSYDDVNRLRLTTEANGMTRGFTYDAAGRLLEIDYDRYGKTLGNFIYEVDGRGNRTQVFERVPRPTTGSNIVVNYDDNAVVYTGTWAESSPSGFMETSTTDDLLSVIFYGDEVEVTLQTNPAGGNFEIWVDGSLRLSDNAYASSPATEVYPLTGLGEWTHSLVVINTDASATLKFQQAELIGDVILYEDQTVQYDYDALSRLKQARYYAGANTGATPHRQYDYSFDMAGNLVGKSLVLDGGSPAIETLTYDEVNRISSSGFAYDDAGRMTSDGVNTYTWDRANRLLAMGDANYAYNGLGQRVEQTVSSIVTKYLLDMQPQLMQVLAVTTGSDTTHYVHSVTGPESHKDENGNWEYLLSDGQRSVRGVADTSAGVLESRLYSPIGSVIETHGTQQTIFGFTGEPTDITELLYLRARYYNPVLGVFPNLDPVEGDVRQPMSLNRYAWVQGNVVNLVDPSGMVAECLAPWDPCGRRLRQVIPDCSCYHSGSQRQRCHAGELTVCPPPITQEQSAYIRSRSVVISVGCDGPGTTRTQPSEFCGPTSNPDLPFGGSLGTLTPAGIVTHDHWATGLGYPAGLDSTLWLLGQFDWIEFEGELGYQRLKTSDLTVEEAACGSVVIRYVNANGFTILDPGKIGVNAEFKVSIYDQEILHCAYIPGANIPNLQWINLSINTVARDRSEYGKLIVETGETAFISITGIASHGDSGGGCFSDQGGFAGMTQAGNYVIPGQVIAISSLETACV